MQPLELQHVHKNLEGAGSVLISCRLNLDPPLETASSMASIVSGASDYLKPSVLQPYQPCSSTL